jgi:hypothetical protein
MDEVRAIEIDRIDVVARHKFPARWRPTLSACSAASRRTLWSPTRPTA